MVELVLADSPIVSCQISEAMVELPPCGQYYSPVILGESEDDGAVTLEIFGLMLNPMRRVLTPIRAGLKQSSF